MALLPASVAAVATTLPTSPHRLAPEGRACTTLFRLPSMEMLCAMRSTDDDGRPPTAACARLARPANDGFFAGRGGCLSPSLALLGVRASPLSPLLLPPPMSPPALLLERLNRRPSAPAVALAAVVPSDSE